MPDPAPLSAPSLDDLPPPPSGTADWPWSEEVSPLPEKRADGSDWPRISLVTPSYNQGRFLEQTIRSVLLQGYPNLEYIVMDGGSTDGSVEVIEKYAPWLTYWESTSDRGAAHAINKGLARVSGDWFNWLNSDDYLLPNALKMLVRLSQHVPDAKWISGGRIDVTEEGLPGRLRCPWLHHPNTVGLGKAHFLQDATFVQTAFLREHGITIPEEYSNAFDTVFFYRLLQHEKPLLTTTPFSAMRWHEAQKTADKANRRHEYQTGVLPFLQGRPLIIRALSAMLQSKFHPVVRALILLLTFYGLLPESSDWTACVYDNFEGEIREIEARRLVLLQGR